MRQGQPLYIAYPCFGHEAFFCECIYSLLSLCRIYSADELKQIEVWIYTDKPEWFDRFPDMPLQLKFRKVTEKELSDWHGSIGYRFRSKMEIARDLVKNKTGNILYLDTDTFFIQPIDAMVANIENGTLYMHVMEGLVKNGGNNILEKLHQFLQKGPITVNGKTIAMPEDIAMWNSGVLGFNAKYGYLVDEALAFTDEVFPRFNKHNLEQFAFSVVYTNTSPIHAAAPYILHYWGIKEIRPVLVSFFQYMKGKSWDELLHYSQMVQIPVYMLDKISFLTNRTVMGKIQKKQWVPVMPEWERLIKQL